MIQKDRLAYANWFGSVYFFILAATFNFIIVEALLWLFLVTPLLGLSVICATNMLDTLPKGCKGTLKEVWDEIKEAWDEIKEG